MASRLTAPQTGVMYSEETRNAAVDLSGTLDEGETISSVVEVSAEGLTITNNAVTTSEMLINDQPVPAGRAFTFSVTGGTNGQHYRIKTKVTTTGGQTIVVFLNLLFLAG